MIINIYLFISIFFQIKFNNNYILHFIIVDSNQLMDCILYRSSLARDLATIYDSLISNRIAHVVINNSVDLSLQIPPLLPSLDDNEENLLSDEQILSNDTSFPTLRPYHALLLLEDPEEILKSFPKDPSPTLVELIQVVTPMQW